MKNGKYKTIAGGSNILSKNGITSDILNSQCVRTSKGYRKSSSNSPILSKSMTENCGNEEYEKTLLAASNWKDRSGEEEARTGQALYVIGRTAERTGPQNFLHFSMGDVFISRVMLPYVRDVLSLVNRIECPPSPSHYTVGSGGTSLTTTLSHSLSHAMHTTTGGGVGAGGSGGVVGGGVGGGGGVVQGAANNQSTATLCVCAWLQLGTLSSSPTSSFCQLVLPYPTHTDGNDSDCVNAGDTENSNSNNDKNNNNNNKNDNDNNNNKLSSAIVVDVFFRIVYKTGSTKGRERDRERDRDEDSASVVSAESYRENPYNQNDEYRTNSYPEEMKTRRVLQLCVSYNSVLECPSTTANTHTHPHTHIHTHNQDDTVTPPNQEMNDNIENLEFLKSKNNVIEEKINFNDKNYRENKSEWNNTVDEIFGRSCVDTDTEEIIIDSGMLGTGSNVLGKNVPRNGDRNDDDCGDLPGLVISPSTPPSLPLLPSLPLSSFSSTLSPTPATSHTEGEKDENTGKTTTDTNAINKDNHKDSHNNKNDNNKNGENSVKYENSKKSQNRKAETPINENLMSQAMAKIASSVVRHSVPDVVIEHDWTERGDWHLICLSLTLPLSTPAPVPVTQPLQSSYPLHSSLPFPTYGTPVCAPMYPVTPSMPLPLPSLHPPSASKPYNSSRDSNTPGMPTDPTLTPATTVTPTLTPQPPTLSPSASTLPPIVNCWIDGKQKRALKWSTLGYRQDVEGNTNKPSHCDKDISKSKSRGTTNTGSVSSITGVPVQFKPGCCRTMAPCVVLSPWPMNVCVGGLMHEEDAFTTAMKYVRDALCDDINVINDTEIEREVEREKEKEREEMISQAHRDLLFIQSHKVLVGGFTGSIGELCVLDGIPSEHYMVMCTKKGPGQKDSFSVLCGASIGTTSNSHNHDHGHNHNHGYGSGHGQGHGNSYGEYGGVRVLTSLVPSSNVRREEEKSNGAENAPSPTATTSSSSSTTATAATAATAGGTSAGAGAGIGVSVDAMQPEVGKERKGKAEEDAGQEEGKETVLSDDASVNDSATAISQSTANTTDADTDKEEGKDKDNEVKKERRASEIFQGSISVKNFSRQNTGEVVTRARGSSESTLFLRSLSQDRDREKKITTGRSSDELALVRVIGGGNSGVSDGMTGEKVGTSGVDDGSKSRDGEKRTTSTQSPVTPPHTSFSSSSLRTRILGGGGILSTFFSSPSRQRGRAGSPVRYVSTPKQHVPQGPPLESALPLPPTERETCKLTGDVQLHFTHTMGDAMTSLGGFKLLYPLLVADRTRQVASVRVIASILNKKDMYAQYLQGHTDKVLLYCLHAVPGVTSAETIQVLFDLAISLTHASVGEGDGEGEGEGCVRGLTGSGINSGIGLLSVLSSHPTFNKGQGNGGGGGGGREGREGGSAGGGGGGGDVISSSAMLSLLCDISLSSIQNVQIARITVDWLRGICDDVCRNNETVMNTLGVTPFLILLSLWGVGIAQTHTLPQPNIDREDIDYGSKGLKKEGVDKKKDKDKNKETDNESDDTDFFASPSSISQSDGYRLQLSCTRFLKQLLTGTSGDQSVPAGAGAGGGDSPHRSVPTLDSTLGSYMVKGPGSLGGVGGGMGGGIGLGRRKGEVHPIKSNNSRPTFGVFPTTAVRNLTAAVSPSTSTGFTVESMVLLFGFIHCMHG